MKTIGSFQRLVFFEFVRLEEQDVGLTCSVCGNELDRHSLAVAVHGDVCCSMQHADELVREWLGDARER
jgi:hypothetical protein